MISKQTTYAGGTRITRITRGCISRGFTLVELLIVVAVIGILVALLLPAVQAAREAARRASCSNNLAQLIMAVHHYESTHQLYPPGTVNPTGPILNQLKGYHHGWIGQMMPFLEKEAVYHRIDRDVSVYHKNNMPVRALHLSRLQCPSNPMGGKGYSNYAALHNDAENPIDVDQNGVFFLNSAVTQDDVSDGVGYTIFLGEKVQERGDLGWMSGTRSILRNTGETINTATDQIRQTRAWNRGTQLPPGVSLSSGKPAGAGGMDSLGGEEESYGLDEMDDRLIVLGGTSPRAAATFVGGFASYHSGGANFAMGDGSTRLIAKTVSTTIYRQLGHRADGELIELQ